MKPWMAGLAQLGLAGSCLFWTGCGGSDVPDPESDSQASTDVAPKNSGGSPAIYAEPAASAPEEPPAGANSVAVVDPRMRRIQAAAPAGGGGGEPVVVAEPTASSEPAATAAASDPANSESSSATNEMLALANASPAAAEADASVAGGATPPGAPGAGGPAGYPGMGPGAGQGQGQQAMRAPSGYPGMPGAGAAGGGKEGSMMASAFPGMAGAAAGRNAQGMRIGGPGGPGRSGGSNTPASFLTPAEGVTAFLNALEDRDLDRLAEAIAKHALVDARESNRKMFNQIADGTLPQDDLDDIAKRLEGYRIVGSDPPRSTGQSVILLQKEEGGDLLGRKITTRKEKAGWKVQDVGAQIDYYGARKSKKSR